MPQPFYPQERDQVPIVQEAGWAPGPIWKGMENLATIGMWSPDCPACNELLYQPPHSGVLKVTKRKRAKLFGDRIGRHLRV